MSNNGASNKKKGFLTLTVIFEAMSLNRDEGAGNFQTLHTIRRKNGVYTFMSRQALTYAVRKCLIESGEWREAPVFSSQDVVQYDLKRASVYTHPELDLFGYMYTLGGENAVTRPAPVTFTHAISIEPYEGDAGFYANHEMVRRGLGEGQKDATPNPFNRQEHLSLYKYSVLIDLERIGNEPDMRSEILRIFNTIRQPSGKNNNEKINSLKSIAKGIGISDEQVKSKDNITELQNFIIDKCIDFLNTHYSTKIETSSNGLENKIEKIANYLGNPIEVNSKTERLSQLLDAIKYLAHQIQGVRWSLVPLFVVGAHIKYGSPLFHNFVELKELKTKVKTTQNHKETTSDDNYKTTEREIIKSIESESVLIDEDTLNQGILHANGALINNRVCIGISRKSGQMRLDINGDVISDIEVCSPASGAIDTIKSWLEDIYKEDSSGGSSQTGV